MQIRSELSREAVLSLFRAARRVRRDFSLLATWSGSARLSLRGDGELAWRLDREGSSDTPLASGTWDEIMAFCRVLPALQRANSEFQIILPARRILSLKMAVPHSARRRIGEIIRIEVERSTPFRWADVLVGYWLTDPEQATKTEPVTADVMVLKRAYAQPLLDDMATYGLILSALNVELEDGSCAPANLLTHRERYRPTLSTRLNRATVALAAVAACSFLVSVGVGAWRTYSELDDIEQRTNAAVGQVVALSKTARNADADFAKVAAARTRKAEKDSFIALWAEMTKLIPDTAWLTGIRLERGKIDIDGYAPSASELLAVLAGSPHFSDVDFTSPVTKDPQNGFEHFQIRMTNGGAP